MPKRTLLSILFVASAVCVFAQKKPLDNTLLWKISGKELTKASYLYGTIHVQDQRVFNFSDSLYRFIQSADGFAMEIHPDSILLALMQKVDEKATGESIRKYLKKEEYDELNVKIKKEFGFDADRLTLKETYLLRKQLAKPEHKADDMPTIVDAYLYGIAKNQGKDIEGLERAIDQVNMLNDLDMRDIDPKKVLKTLKKERSLIDKLVQLYIKEDLNGISEFMSYLPDKAEDQLLNMRNHLMVKRMDSLMQLKSFVVAVGAAHLPGDEGIIELLRQHGYTVEPVLTTTRTHANKYAIKAQEKMDWVEVKEPTLGYSARMPGKPSPMDMLNGAMKMNMYMDMTSMKQYYTAFVLPSVTISRSNADSVLQGLYKNMVKASEGVAVSEKRFARGEFEAIDMLYKITADNMHVRVQSFAFGKRVYLVGMGAPKKDDLYGKEATDFFNAFTIENMAHKEWQVQTFNEHYFTLLLPNKPKKIDVRTPDTSMSAVQYMSLDEKNGSFYGVVIATANPGFVVPNDSIYFESAIERLSGALELENLQKRDTIVNGFNGQWITASLKDKVLFKCLSVNRGNRLYSLIASSANDDESLENDVEFFNSFSFIEYPKVSWTRANLANIGFTVPVTSSFSRIKYLDGDAEKDEGAPDSDLQWTGFDTTTATSFTVTRRNVNPYLWAKHDSIALKMFMNLYVNPSAKFIASRYDMSFMFSGDVVKEYRFVKNGNVSGIEFLVTKRNTKHTEYVRILLNGKARYILQTDVPQQYWKTHEFDTFLRGFQVSKEEKTDYLRTNSFQKLLAGIRSTDSATYATAYEAIDEVVFESSDVPELIAAGVTEFPLDTFDYRLARNKFLEIAREQNHPDFNALVLKQYNALSSGTEKMKYGLLEQLAKTHTTQSYRLIGELLSKGLPTQGRVYGFVHGLVDSLELTKTLYPQLLSYTADSLLGTPLCQVHKAMLDTNQLSITDVKRHEATFLKAANTELDMMAKDNDPFYYSVGLYDLLHILAELKSEASIGMLRKFAEGKHMYVKCEAVYKLIKIGQPVDASVLLSIAADRVHRTDLYEAMEKKKIQHLFPAKYLNQKAFAESYLETSLEEGAGEMEFIGEKTITYHGKKQKFYLFKVIEEDYEEGGKISYLGVSGPFEMDNKKLLVTEEYMSGIYYEEKYSKSTVDKLFRLYLAQFDEEKVDDVKIGTILPPPPPEKKD